VEKRDSQPEKAMLEELRKAKEEVEQKVKERTAELEASKAYIESMFNAIPDPITVVDVNSKFIAVNRAASELLGYREDELSGCPTSKLLVPRERHLAGKMTAQFVALGKTIEYERTLLTKDGVEIPVVFHGAPLRDAKGEIIGSVAVARDMREIKVLIGELEHRKAFIENLFSALADAVIVTDREGTIVTVNRAATELLGYQEDELVGQHTRMLLVPEQRHLGGTGLKEAIAKGDSLQYERKHQTKDGVEIPVLLHTSPLRDSQGATIGSISVIRDIREIKSFITKLARSEERYRALFEHAPWPCGVVDSHNILQLWNKQAEKHMGYKAEEIIGRSTRMLVPDDLYEEGKWLMREVREKGYVKDYETERLNKNGVRVPGEVAVAALNDEEGNFIGAEFMVKDISERKRLERERAEAQEALARSEERYRALFEHAPDPICVTDADDIVLLWNERAEECFGFKAEEIIGKPAWMMTPDDLIEDRKRLKEQVKDKGYVRAYETERVVKGGVRIPLEVTEATIRDDKGDLIGLSIIARDISERKRMEQEVAAKEFYRVLSIVDELTGLYNHRHFHELLSQGLRWSERYLHPLSLLMVDIDNFKEYQDVRSHVAGDEALKIIAQTMRNTVRGVDMGARYGGDEFAVILPETTKEVAAIAAERIANAIAEITLPAGGRLTISVGVASYPTDAQNKEELIRRADQALYRAKQRGRNRTCIWEQ
jgi:diguanylate cyclase (GGDEF)-like protein/PAS domain S-box-containing protein